MKKIIESGFGRRSFLKMLLLAGSTVLVSLWNRRIAGASTITGHGVNLKSPRREKLIFIAIDALHPDYFDLDAHGFAGGREGNWLMPNIRAFLKKAVWYRNARAFLPAATDMNHLNALAGTSSAQTGILGVWAQPTGWNEKKEPVIQHTSMAFARDDRGRPVDTLFQAWKRKHPGAKTLLITGKEWVGEMFRQGQGIDILVTGPKHPDYLQPPRREGMSQPPAGKRECAPTATRLGTFDGSLALSNLMTRAYTGQKSFLTWQMEHFAEHFPHDSWIVDSTLEIFRRENPDLAYILLAQCDDAGHCLGSASDPAEFVATGKNDPLPEGCKEPEYRLTSRRNKLLYRERILNVIRDVDTQFGRLIDGLTNGGALGEAAVILLSDHSAVNHLYTENFASTDVMGLLKVAGFGVDRNIYSFSVSSYGVLYWRDKKEEVPRAKSILLAHRAINPQTGKTECPWWVLDRSDMKNGVEGVCGPGELYHTYYVDTDRERSVIWPDLMILGKNGWQIPVYNGHIVNVGVKVPSWMPPWRVYNGGHGSVDTLPIVAAVSVPGGTTGIRQEQIRIADLGVTAASLFGLKLQSTTIGRDLSRDLVKDIRRRRV